MDNREGYNFPYEIKKEAFERSGYRCEVCGAQDDETNRLEVDHTIAIWFARETNCLSAEVIKSIANATVLCHQHHREKHSHESRQYYAELAPTVLISYLEKVVDHHKDDWREKLVQYQQFTGHD